MPRKNQCFVFIDAENMRKMVRACGYKRMNYVNLYRWLTNKRGANRVYFYAGYIEGDTQELAKFKGFEKLGYTLRVKEIQEYPPKSVPFQVKCENCSHVNHRVRKIQGNRKANCDSELTLDVINQGARNRYNEIIVFSGDGDFSEMYKYISGLRCKVSVFSALKFPADRMTSTKLKELDREGAINLISLESVLQHYADK